MPLLPSSDSDNPTGITIVLLNKLFPCPTRGLNTHPSHHYHHPPNMDASLTCITSNHMLHLALPLALPHLKAFVLDYFRRKERIKGTSNFVSSDVIALLDTKKWVLINKSQLLFDLYYSLEIWSKFGNVGNKRFKAIKYSVIRTVYK